MNISMLLATLIIIPVTIIHAANVDTEKSDSTQLALIEIEKERKILDLELLQQDTITQSNTLQRLKSDHPLKIFEKKCLLRNIHHAITELKK